MPGRAVPANASEVAARFTVITATAIQTVAAVVQAVAAAVFLGSVVWDAKRRARLSEQERRERIIKGLLHEWSQTALPPTESDRPKTPAEIGGIFSQRQIDFFNTRLTEMGENWTYPYKRVRWW